MDILTNPTPLSLNALIFNMLLGIVLSTIVAFYYARFGEALSNRRKFSRLLPMLSLVTILVISVVKASLALSLGLVGALSIVRFRTAIKDPEELIYLFLSIAIGLGLGADQRIPTLAAVGLIMCLLIGMRIFAPQSLRRNLYGNITAPNQVDSSSFETINQILTDHMVSAEMRRLDRNGQTMQMTYLVDCRDQHVLTQLMDKLTNTIPEISFSFIDQNTVPGV